jgi:undecaprenyl-diphosphatase
MVKAAEPPIEKRPAERYGLRVLLFGLALVLLGIPFGLLVEQIKNNGPMIRVDTWAANHLHEIVRHSRFEVDVLQVISFVGKPPWLVTICVATGVLLLVRRRYHLAIYLVATTVVGGMIDTAVKVAVGRERPSLDHPVATAFGKSFPSGHAMSSTIAYGALLLIFLPVIPRARRSLAIGGTVVLVLLIGFSRLALGVHYISDVLGGYALGGAWLALSTAAFEVWREDRGLRKSAPLEEGVEPEAKTELAL